MTVGQVILVASAFAIGIIASLLGVGGGFLIVPILIFLSGLTSHLAIGNSLMTLVFTALSSTYAYSIQKRIDYKVGLILAIGTIPGAVLGAYATRYISATLLTLLLGLLLIYISIRMFMRSREKTEKHAPSQVSSSWRRRIVDSSGVVFDYSVDLGRGIPLSFLVGFSSGLLGIGGGIVLMPVLVLGVGFPIHIAVATSMFVEIFTSLSGAI
ncbi:sulfite exporter TauE/SafE family protein, partial [Candidatus Bathyarchaeota archaeon]|nr:sulfite exporter TauE/SafE family protein [Candidatus Bathyarchaeota archaeon]